MSLTFEIPKVPLIPLIVYDFFWQSTLNNYLKKHIRWPRTFARTECWNLTPELLTITIYWTQLTFMPELLTKYAHNSNMLGHFSKPVSMMDPSILYMVNVVIVSLPGVWCAGLNGSGLSAEIPPEAPSWCLVRFAGISTNPTLSVKAIIWVKTIVATEWFTIVSVYSSNVFNVSLHPQNIIELVTRPASYSLLNGLIQGNGFLGAI